MSSDAYIRFSKILKESGGPADGKCFQWMFNDEAVPGYKLLHWIADNITSDNYLTVTEQREYQELVSQGKYLTGDKLAQSMLDIENEYPGLTLDSFEDCDSDELEQIEMLTKQTELIRQCINDLDDNSSSYEKLKEKDYIVSSELKSVEEECSNATQTLQDTEHDLQYAMLQVQNLYDHQKSGNVFLNQMDMEALLETLQLVRKNTKLYLEHQFQQTQNVEHIATDLMMLYERLVEGYYHDVSYEADLEAWKACCQELPEIYNKYHTIADVDEEIDSLTANCSALENRMESYLQEIKSSAEKYTLRLVMKALFEDNERKLAKRLASYEKLTAIESFLQDRTCTWELLWRSLTIEGNFLEHMQSIYKDIQSNTKVRERNILLRVYDLNKILEMQSQEPHLQLNDSISDPCVQLLQHKGIHLKALGENSNIIDIYNKLAAETNNEIVLCRGKLNSALDNMNKLDVIINNKNSLIFDHISKSPVCISPLHYPIYKCRNNLLQLEEQIKALKDVYKSKKQSFKSSIVLDAQRQLWIYFLCEPKKVLSTLDKIKAMIQSNSKVHRSNI